MKIYSQFDPHELVMEKNTGETEVDLALYRPTRKRIEDMIRSGETLEDVRRLRYHSDELNNMVDNENWEDPLLYRGYDRVDLEMMHREAIESILERRRHTTVEQSKNEETNPNETNDSTEKTVVSPSTVNATVTNDDKVKSS